MHCLPNLDLVSTHLINMIDYLITATAVLANYFCDHLQLSRCKLPEHLCERKNICFWRSTCILSFSESRFGIAQV